MKHGHIWMHPAWNQARVDECFEAVRRVLTSRASLADMRVALLMSRLGMLAVQIDQDVRMRLERQPAERRRALLFSLSLADQEAKELLKDR